MAGVAIAAAAAAATFVVRRRASASWTRARSCPSWTRGRPRVRNGRVATARRHSRTHRRPAARRPRRVHRARCNLQLLKPCQTPKGHKVLTVVELAKGSMKEVKVGDHTVLVVHVRSSGAARPNRGSPPGWWRARLCWWPGPGLLGHRDRCARARCFLLLSLCRRPTATSTPPAPSAREFAAPPGGGAAGPPRCARSLPPPPCSPSALLPLSDHSHTQSLRRPARQGRSQWRPRRMPVARCVLQRCDGRH